MRFMIAVRQQNSDAPLMTLTDSNLSDLLRRTSNYIRAYGRDLQEEVSIKRAARRDLEARYEIAPSGELAQEIAEVRDEIRIQSKLVGPLKRAERIVLQRTVRGFAVPVEEQNKQSSVYFECSTIGSATTSEIESALRLLTHEEMSRGLSRHCGARINLAGDLVARDIDPLVAMIAIAELQRFADTPRSVSGRAGSLRYSEMLLEQIDADPLWIRESLESDPADLLCWARDEEEPTQHAVARLIVEYLHSETTVRNALKKARHGNEIVEVSFGRVVDVDDLRREAQENADFMDEVEALMAEVA